ncbi:YIEGIA family protein [Dethiobacter alkaliphilus]|uniref:YIEGIA family protein n=1 Tax=Dethiobacter alkaliphilus TaxID=427926 RepID=UPI002226B7AA|nr:YIEGIA family protein [Dethiobacter alkaliphilus]MCW3491503.1 YIEGIA family protein [Dethiobacter alkaliphilus]
MTDDLMAIAAGIIVGTLARYWMMSRDVRQYPSYPHAVINHLALGFLAATLGAVAVPALAAEEYTAVTFLALAATQFREVRNMEREMLGTLEHSEMVVRGPDFIEGIARTFEARNYLVLLVALITSAITFWVGLIWGVVAGILTAVAVKMLKRGKKIGDIAKVRPGDFRFEGPDLFIEDIHIMNLGLQEIRQEYEEKGRALVIEPHDDNAREILANVGQRQAIAHDAASLLGIHRDVDTAEFTPLLRRDTDTGRIGMIMVPIEPDTECLVMAVKNVPVLESALVNPLASGAGRCASD